MVEKFTNGGQCAPKILSSGFVINTRSHNFSLFLAAPSSKHKVDSTPEISLSVFGGDDLKISSEVAQKVGPIAVAYHCHDLLDALESCYQKFMSFLHSELYQIVYRRETGLFLVTSATDRMLRVK